MMVSRRDQHLNVGCEQQEGRVMHGILHILSFFFNIAEWYSLWTDESAHSSDDGSDLDFIVTLWDRQVV